MMHSCKPGEITFIKKSPKYILFKENNEKKEIKNYYSPILGEKNLRKYG